MLSHQHSDSEVHYGGEVVYSQAMAMYRLYCLNDDENVVESHWIEAVSEDEAIENVKKNHPNSRCEIWLGKRLVAEIRP